EWRDQTATVVSRWPSKHLSCGGEEVLDDRSQAQGWEERQCPDDENHRNQQQREQWAIGGKGAQAWRYRLLADHRSGDRQHRYDHQKTSDQHGDPEADVPPRGVGVQSSKG